MVRCQYLSGRAEHATGCAGAWSGRHTHDAPSHLRKGDRGRARFAAWRSFLCHHSHRVSDGKIRAGTARPAAKDRLQGSLGTDLGGRVKVPIWPLSFSEISVSPRSKRTRLPTAKL